MKHLADASQNEKQIYGLLSLCTKAGKVKSGGQILYDCIASGEAKLVLVATDASENTRKKCFDKCAWNHVPVMLFGTVDEMGRVMGKTERAGVAVTDAGFAQAIQKKTTRASEGRETNGKA